MLRPSKQNTKISAHAMMEKLFDFNKTYLAPLDIKAIVHGTPSRRRTSVQHGVQSWYIVLVVEHYLCYKVYIPNTRSELIADTVELFSNNTTMPGISSADAATHAATNLISALENTAPANRFAAFGAETLDALCFKCYTYSKDKSQENQTRDN